jgi:hypothetical protein
LRTFCTYPAASIDRIVENFRQRLDNTVCWVQPWRRSGRVPARSPGQHASSRVLNHRLVIDGVVGCCSPASGGFFENMHEPTEENGMVKSIVISNSCCLPLTPDWRRQLSIPQKRSYIDAVLCLSQKEAKSGINSTVNRFDDHQAVHMEQKPQIHWVVCQPSFLSLISLNRSSRATSSFGTDTSSRPTRKHLGRNVATMVVSRRSITDDLDHAFMHC